MENTKTHWKKTVDTDWIGVYVLPNGNPVVVKLINIIYSNVKIQGSSDKRVVAYFEKNKYFDKPMLLNSTNMKRVAKLTKSPYIEDWQNLNIHVTLQKEMDKAIGGGKDWALRISGILPRIKTIDDYPEEKKALFGCKDMDELKKVYTAFTKELQALFAKSKNSLKKKFDENN